MDLAIQIELADFEKDFPDIQLVRETVFIQEQHITPELEWDEFDAQAIHIIAKVEDQAIGTARLLDNGLIGRVAVLKPWRKQGVGYKMMHYLMNLAKQQHHAKIHIHAQLIALDFYRKLGFIECGKQFEEAGILHQTALYHF